MHAIDDLVELALEALVGADLHRPLHQHRYRLVEVRLGRFQMSSLIVALSLLVLPLSVGDHLLDGINYRRGSLLNGRRRRRWRRLDSRGHRGGRWRSLSMLRIARLAARPADHRANHCCPIEVVE